MKTNSENGLNLFFWGNQLVEATEVRKKEIMLSTDIMALRYAAMELIDSCNEIFDNRDEIEDHSIMQDGELYLNDFEGYYYSDTQILKTLYISDDNRIILSVYNDKEGNYIDYLIY